MGHRVLAALCHKRGTSAIRLPGATSIFNAELRAILIALGGSHVDQNTIYKYLKHTAL